MKRLSALLLFAALVAGSSALGGDGKDKKDELQGKWEVVSSKMLGKEKPLADGGVHMTFEAGKVKFKEGMKAEEDGTYKLDTAKKPKEIVITPNKGPALPGIYQLDGDKLKICFGLPDFKDKLVDAKPPTSFNDEKTFLLELKRVKQ